MIRVVIADDEPLMRAGLKALLDAREDIEVVGAAADGAETVRLARSLVPDIVLMDIRMPDVDGLEATRQIVEDPRLAAVRVVTSRRSAWMSTYSTLCATEPRGSWSRTPNRLRWSPPCGSLRKVIRSSRPASPVAWLPSSPVEPNSPTETKDSKCSPIASGRSSPWSAKVSTTMRWQHGCS